MVRSVFIYALSICALSICAMGLTGAPALAATPQVQQRMDATNEALISGDLSKAADEAEAAIELAPNDAAVHKLAGDTFGIRAQNASLFSAPGLAKKSLKAYKKAVELAPDNAYYRFSLMQYYLIAPGIVGGDKDLAKQQITEIAKLDAARATVAEHLLYTIEEDQQKIDELFKNIDPALVNHPSVMMEQATYLKNQKQAELAMAKLDAVRALPPQELAKTGSDLAHYQAMVRAGFLGLESDNATLQEQAIDAFTVYLNTAPLTYKLASKQWVRYFLGESYAKIGKIGLARKAFEQARNETINKDLLKKVKSALKKLK